MNSRTTGSISRKDNDLQYLTINNCVHNYWRNITISTSLGTWELTKPMTHSGGTTIGHVWVRMYINM